MVSFLLQENIDELQHLADHLLHIGDKNVTDRFGEING